MMINFLKLKKSFNRWLAVVSVFAVAISVSSCDYEFELPESFSQPDLTPPSADFAATQSDVDFLMYNFSNLSTSATRYEWNFGDGNTSTEVEPTNTYPAEGTYTVTLTASDNNGIESTFSADIEVVEPVIPTIPDPVLLNADFDRLPKSSGSDCTCSGWINRSVGDQGESSSGNGSDVLKFDNNEPDHVYQEFAVTPNADYTIEIPFLFQSDRPGDLPSQLEIRVLAGEGYVVGYTPTYYTDTVAIPQDGFGYTSVAQVEDAANNLLVEVVDNPNDSAYRTLILSFNAGANDSAALFIRGIGGPATGGGGGDFGYNSGDEEIRADSVTITAIN